MAKNKSANRKLTGRDELNLIDYPLSIFSKSLPVVEDDDETADKNKKEIFITDPKTKKLKQGYVKISSNLKGHSGALIAGDEDILIALMELTAESGFKSPKVEFKSQRAVLSKIGWSSDGGNYVRFLDALRRLRSLTIETNVFYDKPSKSYGHKIFGLLDEAFIATQSNKNALEEEDQRKKSPGGYIVWNATIWESFKSGNIKYLDTELYRKIKSASARKLFRILDKRFYRYDVVSLPLQYLAGNLLNLDDEYGEWYYRKHIAKYSIELIKHGYLKEYSFVERNNVTYAEFTINSEMDKHEDDLFDQDNGAEDDISGAVYEKLIVFGYDDDFAKELMFEYEITCINDWLECIESGCISGLERKTGFLVEALRKNYEFPVEFLKRKKSKQIEKVAASREERRRNCPICKGEGGMIVEVERDGNVYTAWRECECVKPSVN